jgi:hypothetical protein
VSEGIGAPEARAQIDIAEESLESVVTRSRAFDGRARLEVYVDAYYQRPLECLGEEFSAKQYPSHSYTLGMLGASFPRYLAELRLHERAMPCAAGPGWPVLMIELATFERSMREVFDGPGSEDIAGSTPANCRRWARSVGFKCD